MSYFYKIKPVDNWTQMYYKYRDYVFNRTKCLPLEDREDIFSSLWFTVKRIKETYNPNKGMKPSTYFFWVFRLVCFRLIKKARGRLIRETSIEDLKDNTETHFNISVNEENNTSYVQDEKDKFIENLISNLPEDYKFIIRYYYGLGGREPKNLTELSRIMGCSPSNCKNKKNNALKKIRARIKNNDTFKNIGEILDYDA